MALMSSIPKLPSVHYATYFTGQKPKVNKTDPEYKQNELIINNVKHVQPTLQRKLKRVQDSYPWPPETVSKDK